MPRPPIYPWRTLEIGESFTFPGSFKSAKSQAWAAGKRTGRKFEVKFHEDLGPWHMDRIEITRVEAPEGHQEAISPEASTEGAA